MGRGKVRNEGTADRAILLHQGLFLLHSFMNAVGWKLILAYAIVGESTPGAAL